MVKSLRDITPKENPELMKLLNQAHNNIAGVRPSKTAPGETGTDPGVDYAPKPGDERKWIAAHSVEKHADRVGNVDHPYTQPQEKYDLNFADEKRHGRKRGEDKKVYESSMCNETPAGVMCEVHGMENCYGGKKLLVDKKVTEGVVSDFAKKIGNTLRKLVPKNNAAAAADKVKAAREYNAGMWDRINADQKEKFKTQSESISYDREMNAIDALRANMGSSRLTKAAAAAHLRKLGYHSSAAHHKSLSHLFREETQIDEVLNKATSVDDVIHDFVHSSNPKFAGKSKQERIKMALGAYYGMHPEKRKKVEESNVKGPNAMVVYAAEAKSKEGYQTWPGQKKKKFFTSKEHEEETKKWLERKRAEREAAAIKPVKEGTYYGVHPEKTRNTNEDLAMPLLQGDDDSGADMVKTELRALSNKAMHLTMTMPDGMHVEPWVQAKIAQAKELVSSVHDYMVYGDHDKPEEKEEGTPYDGGINLSYPSFSADVNTGRNV